MVSRCWILLLIIGLFFLACAGPREPADDPAKAAAVPAEQAALKTKIEQGLEEARRLGKTSVDIYLDDSPTQVGPGDLARVDYTAGLDDGSLIRTTFRSEAEKKERAPIQSIRESYEPEVVLAGGANSIPELGAAIIGMSVGEKKRVTISPERSFGLAASNNISRLPVEKRMPKTVSLTIQQYANQFGVFPIVGKEVNLVPYFKSKVVEVTEQYVQLQALIEETQLTEHPFGTVESRPLKEEIVFTMTPKVGGPFELNGRNCRITTYDGEFFTVDCNHPLAGRPILLDVEVLSLTKRSEIPDKRISWIEDYDKGLEVAKNRQLPAVLLLYAGWCDWSKRLMTETMEDPRVRLLADKLLWIKVNSDEQRDLYELYDQKGFPLVVLLNPKGDVLKKIDGYKDGGAMAMELKGFLDQKVAKK